MKRTMSGWKRFKCRYCGRSFPNVVLALNHRAYDCPNQVPAYQR